MDARRLLLGDWHPVVRDPIDVLRATLLVGVVVFLVRGDGGAAAVLAIAFVAVLLARLVNLPRIYDLSFVAAASLQAWGEAVNAYDTLPWFDRLVHVVVPLLSAPVIYIALARLEVLPDPRDETHTEHYVGIFVVTLALGLAVGAVWEMVEWTSDGAFGTDLSLNNDDTVRDLVADLVGSVIGGALLVVWTLFGWGSVRRVPGENLYEEVDA